MKRAAGVGYAVLLSVLLTSAVATYAQAVAVDDVRLVKGKYCNTNIYGMPTVGSGVQVYLENHSESSAVLVTIKEYRVNDRGERYASYNRKRVEIGSETFVGCTGEGSFYGSGSVTYEITGAHYVD